MIYKGLLNDFYVYIYGRVGYILLFAIAGFVLMMIFASIFISTKVETFNRNSLFGVMPLWLPFLWAYTFVTIKRVINILK